MKKTENGVSRALIRFCRKGSQFATDKQSTQSLSVTGMFHNFRWATQPCRRRIEKSPLAQIEMSLSTVSVGEYLADDGDCDEPDGDRPDERVAGSGCKQDQGCGRRDADGSWPASGGAAGQGRGTARS